MDRLWTPWRFEYIRQITPSESGCVFCRVLAESADASNYVLHRGASTFALLNRFPYTAGHILIVLNRHIARLTEASLPELHEMIEIAQACERALKSEYGPEGYNAGFNIGRAAGAGVEHHLHMHFLPRWIGDSNFVSVVGETRVLPEELPTTYQRLVPYFAGLAR